MESICCLQCGGVNLDPLVSGHDFENPTRELFQLEKCRRCGLVIQNPRPTAEELPKYYSSNKYYSYSELQKKESRQIGRLEKLRHFLFEKTIGFYYGRRRAPIDWVCAWIGKGRFGAAPLHMNPGKILDIGCGDGVFLDVVRRLGWEPYGVEINAEAAKCANQRGLKVHAGDLLSARYSNNTFDVVRIWSVLEHIGHPLEVLREIHRVLKPDGLLLLQVPNIDSLAFQLFGPHWTGLDLPRHLTHFSPSTLRQAMTSCGFEVPKLQFSSVGTVLSSFQYRRAKQNGAVGLMFPVLRVAVVFFDRLCDFLRKGDCMVAWGVKR